jgi:hypothetical protein
MPPMPRDLRLKRRLAATLTLVFLFSTLFPTGFAAAQALFSRPGPGVARLPLHVLAFDLPAFGTVQDAINLASGNVYVSMDGDGLARNNLLAADDTSIGGGNWKLLPVMRIERGEAAPQAPDPEPDPFPGEPSPSPPGPGPIPPPSDPYEPSPSSVGANDAETVSASTSSSSANGADPIPPTFTLRLGDGASFHFEHVTSLASGQPSWLERYRAQLNATAHLYRIKPEAGVQYSQEWIAFLPSVGQGVVHYYTRTGTRFTFRGADPYVAYSQNLYQYHRRF